MTGLLTMMDLDGNGDNDEVDDIDINDGEVDDCETPC